MDSMNNLVIYSNKELVEKVKEYNRDWYQFYKKISKEKTPQVDGKGNKIINKRPDGFDYIIESYMRECLDKHFPGWSWEGNMVNTTLNFITVNGHLSIIDPYLVNCGINPPYRKFHGVGASRIQFKRGMPLTPENVVDIDKNIKSANSAALKYAINRLTHIGDDVYGKRIEEEGAGTYEDIVNTSIGLDNDNASSAFAMWLNNNKILASKAFAILKVGSIADIKDYKSAMNIIKKELGIK